MDKTLEHALRDAGAVLVRQKRHRIYKLPNGRVLTVSNTPSDRRDTLNTLRTLRRLQ